MNPLDTIGVKVELTPAEGNAAKGQGLLRNKSAKDAGRTNNYGLQGAGEKEDILGAIGERVVAKYLGVPWNSGEDFSIRHDGDVAGFEVRTTKHRNGRLLIAPGDDPKRIYILVTYEKGWVFVIRGWMLGAKAMEYPLYVLVEGRPAVHTVLQSELQKPEGLKDL